jgi:2-polyprenyl-6-hydroxyphenyl methylase/3-demethylubiquinone-9 3-methyltransferase
MTNDSLVSGYKYDNAALNPSHKYLLPEVLSILNKLQKDQNLLSNRLFEVGCGNGSVANLIKNKGWDIYGIDPSVEGISYANKYYPKLKLYLNSVYDDLADLYGTFTIVISLEVIEHLYSPKKYISTVYSLLDSGGYVILSTPFHGYWKNLALAITNKFDDHFTAILEHGHIKFWSVKTITKLLEDAGFIDIKIKLVGRFPIFAKSMVVLAKKP